MRHQGFLNFFEFFYTTPAPLPATRDSSHNTERLTSTRNPTTHAPKKTKTHRKDAILEQCPETATQFRVDSRYEHQHNRPLAPRETSRRGPSRPPARILLSVFPLPFLPFHLFHFRTPFACFASDRKSSVASNTAGRRRSAQGIAQLPARIRRALLLLFARRAVSKRVPLRQLSRLRGEDGRLAVLPARQGARRGG